MLRKRYFDAVAADGTWWIAYQAEFRLAGLGLRYDELRGSRLSRPWWRLAAGQADGPSRFGSAGGWAEWRIAPASPPAAHETPVLHWRLTGHGGGFAAGPEPAPVCETYAEDLRLKAPPWRLGIRTLHWGRVAAEGLFVTWIVADGPRPIRFAVVDGQTFIEGVQIDGDVLTTPAGVLRLGETLRTIEGGDVRRGRSALVRALSRLAFGAGAIVQHKAVRRCEAAFDGRPRRTCVAIAETVIFSG